MRVVFMGTPEIAATCLEGLLTGGYDSQQPLAL